jgi:hypothetical protein
MGTDLEKCFPKELEETVALRVRVGKAYCRPSGRASRGLAWFSVARETEGCLLPPWPADSGARAQAQRALDSEGLGRARRPPCLRLPVTGPTLIKPPGAAAGPSRPCRGLRAKVAFSAC